LLIIARLERDTLVEELETYNIINCWGRRQKGKKKKGLDKKKLYHDRKYLSFSSNHGIQ